ncbi:uncharacterized protein METZ01_LOCUS417428 [marine metagenome]|uniref:Uncharacterized protein n=1 Tax=marine metagenome TaxID=408172 RepID=A0A382X135_9ZZZZ
MLVLRDDTLACLELLEEDRLALSSLITVEARVAVVDEPPLSLLQEIMVKLRNEIRIMYKTFFIFFPISKVKYYGWMY